MNRRHFLASTVALTTIAGCTSQPASKAATTSAETSTTDASSKETSTTTTEITSTEPTDDGEATLGELRYFLEDRLDVETFQYDGTDIIIEYLQESKQRSDYVDSVSIVTFEFAAHVELGGAGEQVTARTVDEFGDTETVYYIQRDWVVEYNQDEDVTDTDLLKKVADENHISLLA
ncbi:hypothetical protein [Halobacterium sp. BOL4-2]|uniref:hypothetical protein n=1 Tax=Halobacterium sp. BOL4-2 TaxID=2810537 RepID=UPI00196487AD|nr:hypothetical protein [Halobacterium sp. BOL4-2]QRY26359.1 hypothetical protein JRZ79_13285 [Halobacterium sp. BOL4-2]